MNAIRKLSFRFFCSPLTLVSMAASGLTVIAANPATAQTNVQAPEEVTITATRLPRTLEEIAGTVSVVTAETIDKELADDLDDIVRFQPGVSLNTATRGGNQGFSIRGIGGNRVLTVIDGVRSNDIYAAGPSSYGKDSFELASLKSVEIIRGPASVLYGADAMGGAVVLSSKQPRDYVGADSGSYVGLHSSAADADSQYRAGLTTALQNNKFGGLLQFTSRRFEEQDVAGQGRLNPQDGESENLLFKGVWDMNDSQQLVLGFEHYEEEVLTDIQSELSTTVFSSRGRDQSERQRLGVEYRLETDSVLLDSLQLVANVQDSDALQHTIQERISYSFINPMDPTSYGGSRAQRDTQFEFNQRTRALNLNLRKTFAAGAVNHDLAYGFNYDETETERPRNRCEEELISGSSTCSIASYPFAAPEVFPNKTFPDSTTTRFGLYLQNELSLGDSGLTLIPGIRYDRYELQPHPDALLDGTGEIEGYGFLISAVEENQTSLSLGVIYDLDETYSVFAQYAEGYRPPNFDESNQAFVNLGHRYATVPNPALQAESSQGLELGLRADFARAFISLAAYNNQYEDFIESSFVGSNNGISLFQDRNIGAVEIQGLEASANISLTAQWQLRASVAYARGDNEHDNTALDSVEPLTTVLGLGYGQASGHWGGELLLTLAAEKDRVSSPDRVKAEAYSVTDAVAWVNLAESATLRLGVFNLFDEEYARWANIQGLAASASENIANAQQPGRNFRMSLKLEF